MRANMDLRGHFQQVLESLPIDLADRHCVVAYSGGLDSHVLLHLCLASGLSVRAVHIHHGLQAEADRWDAHCNEVCAQLGVAYTCIHVDVDTGRGISPEDAARKARYLALEEELQRDHILLTAHHQRDQAETFLLQLMRAAGAAGLAAMPVVKNLGRSYHVRPLLDISQEQLRHYAEKHHLVWVDDPSNADTRYDRNYIRKEVLPKLKHNWPNADQAISQSALLQQESLEIIDAMAAVDLAAVAGLQTNSVLISRLLQLPLARQYNVLRYWINLAGYDKPKRNILQEIGDSVLPAAEDATPLVLWGNTEIRRFRDTLYILPALTSHETQHVYAWDGEQPLLIDALNLELSLEQTRGKGLQQTAIVRGMTVRFRQGGEQLRPHGRQHTHSLKKLMQQACIPPWQRNRIPLIYIEHQLACVCGYWIADSYAVSQDHQGWLPVCRTLGRKPTR
ncbi:MAG: tRNA lysidine(34) synthetase TilS [Gammaproteobacteria bacterium]|nr:tRNA lysidine(34) synthetase TilS [Gammaproteobacteria bacterium]